MADDVTRSEYLEQYKTDHTIEGTELHGGVNGSDEESFKDKNFGG